MTSPDNKKKNKGLFLIKKSIQVSAKAGLFFVLLCVLVVSALVLYLKTDHCRKVIIKRVNANIPGSLAWQDLDFSFLKGEVQVAGGELFFRDNDKIAGFDRFFIFNLRASFKRTLHFLFFFNQERHEKYKKTKGSF